MSRRRGKGEGTIYRHKDKGWCATITAGYDETGRRRRRTIYGQTREEVRQKLARLQTAALDGLLPDAPRLTLAQYLSRWLEDAVRLRVRASSYNHYSNLIRNHINPSLGGTGLSKLQAIHVQGLYRSMEEKGASPRTQQHAHGVLRNALGQAVRWGMLPRNVTDAVNKPKAVKKELRVLDKQEVARLLKAASANRFHALYVLALTTGMRQGELFGLQWEDIDFDRRYLSVRRTLLEVSNEPILGEPKTAKGKRRIELPEAALVALKQHRAKMFAEGHRSSALAASRRLWKSSWRSLRGPGLSLRFQAA